MLVYKPTAGQAGAARVMLVDDSAVVRGLMRRWIDQHGDLCVAATAANGAEAIELARKERPDLIVLDLEMPVMDGITALPHLLDAAPGCKILIASTLSTRNAKISLQAMGLGATDYVAKPGTGSISRSDFEQDLLAKLCALGARAQSVPAERVIKPAPHVVHNHKISALALVASTGGPSVCSQLIPALKPFLPHLSLFIVQHMPAHFTSLFAKDLCALGAMRWGRGYP